MMIIDDYETIAANHARIFPSQKPPPEAISSEVLPTMEPDLIEFSDEDIQNLLAALTNYIFNG